MAANDTKALDRINVNTEEHADQVEDGEERLAGLLYEGCMDLFKEIYDESSRTPSPLSEKERRRLKEDLGKLFLWGDGFGDNMLDQVLGQSLELKNTVLGFISGIGKVLTGKLLTMVCRPQHGGKIPEQAKDLNILIDKAESMIVDAGQIRDNGSDQDSDSDASDCSRSDILEDISSYTTCLMELVPSIDRTFSHVLSKGQMKQQARAASFQVSEPARTYVQYIFNKFPRADVKLIERLGEANCRSHTRVRVQMAHVSSRPEAHPVEGYHVIQDSGLRTFLSNVSTYDVSAPSNVSIQPSNADHQDKLRMYSSTPIGVVTEEILQCKICGKTLEVTETTAWRRHILSHIQPYICTHPVCKDELETFSTCRSWVNHMLRKHGRENVWNCMECTASFNNAEFWRTHVGQDHCIFFSEAHFRIAVSSRKKDEPKMSLDAECPLCLNPVGKGLVNITIHVGKHMEDIALSLLPPEIAVFSEEEINYGRPEVWTEGTTYQAELASKPDIVTPVESDLRGGTRIGAERLTYSNPLQSSELKNHPTSILSTDMVESQSKHKQDSDLLPLPPLVSEEHPRDDVHVESSQRRDSDLPGLRQRTGNPDCLHCQSRRLRCIGFEISEDGRCNNCQRLKKECIFPPASHLEQPLSLQSPPVSPQREGLHGTLLEHGLSASTDYVFSVFVLQTEKPSRTYMKLSDTTIMQSAAAMFQCMEHQSPFRDVQTLQITFQCGLLDRTYLVEREDTEQLPLINSSMEGHLRALSKGSKGTKLYVTLFIEPAGTYGISPDYVAQEDEVLPEPRREWSVDVKKSSLSLDSGVSETTRPSKSHEDQLASPISFPERYR